MTMSDKLHDIVAPVVSDLGLELYDLENNRGTLRVTLDSSGGIGSDQITQATRLISRALDEADPISAAYTLEVSSPGLERTLRRPDHYEKAVGELISVKTRPGFTGERRIRGTLVAVTEEGVVLRSDNSEVSVDFGDVLSARTVFVWEKGEKSNDRSARRRPVNSTQSPGEGTS